MKEKRVEKVHIINFLDEVYVFVFGKRYFINSCMLATIYIPRNEYKKTLKFKAILEIT